MIRKAKYLFGSLIIAISSVSVFGQQWGGPNDQTSAIGRTGNVGIGTTSPDYLLQIHSSNIPTLAIGKSNQNTNGKSSLLFMAGDATSANAFWVNYFKTASTDRLGFVDGGAVERMSILNGGNVGIGITTPSYRLDVNGVVRSYGDLRTTAVGAGNGYFADDGVSTIFSITRQASNEARLQSYGDIAFRTSGNTGQERMRISQGGNVGIGSIAPLTQLDLFDLRFGPISSFPSEGSVSESVWGNYVVGDVNTAQRLRLGVSNDSYTRAEVFLDNSNRPDGTISFKTVNGNGGALTRMFINGDGNIGIGTISPDALLAVKGTIHSKEVKVDLTGAMAGPDYVFEKDYKLPTLEEIKNYIDQNKHLPDVPSAAEMEKNGVQLGKMNMLLLKKVEELTVYAIAMNAKMLEMKLENEERLEGMQKELKRLKK